MSRVGLRLTPHGQLLLEEVADATTLDERVAARLAQAFATGAGEGLVQLGAGEIGQSLPPAFMWWRSFSARYVSALCLSFAGTNDIVAVPSMSPPTAAELDTLVLTAPLMPGAEYISAETLLALWAHIGAAFARQLLAAKTDLQDFLQRLNPAWNLVGRVHFNLAENKRDPAQPFAFMATYTTRLSAQARAQHVPLGEALREYAGAANRQNLLSLLLPVQRAATSCSWLKPLVDAGEIFHPLRWSASDAARFLASVPALEDAGVVVRMPANWRANRPARPQVTGTVGTRAPSALGLDAVLDFRMAITLEGEALSAEEVKNLLSGTENLVLLRGQWVEIDRARLEGAMAQLQAAEALAAKDGLSFSDAMRMLSRANLTAREVDPLAADWAQINAGPWLAETLQRLRAPTGGGGDPGAALNGTLRPYQKAGVEWLHLLTGLGLGACLADDMGLGKTIQVLALLLMQTKTYPAKKPSLLVAPASLLGNWAEELRRFAPSLNALVLHPSALTAAAAKQLSLADLGDVDLAITSYGTLLRLPLLAQMRWQFVVLDEAQAIKNPNAQQTKAAKALHAQARIALTGTPVENHLGDLWSIFDFINPGLLGTAKQFTHYTKRMTSNERNPYGPLRELVRPYILRRMKTDRRVISDLPDKTELKTHCYLTPKQAALYTQTVVELAKVLKDADGIQRKGIVLATLMRLKQICNHPSQWLNDGRWAADDSGKWARLREIVEVIAARQEKMLVFTQFREMTEPLASYLGGLFGRPGLVLHGGTAVKQRKALVHTFQQDETVPFFILSLKAGGSGLNLTAASHVVHFDRWWNPAVENQATDRAFRIGQKKNVLVHKFVCQGTVEDKIDALIEAKKSLSEDLLVGPSSEINLTELPDTELIRLVTLDLNAVMKD